MQTPCVLCGAPARPHDLFCGPCGVHFDDLAEEPDERDVPELSARLN